MVSYNPDFDHRRSFRLRDYDYSQGGAYYVTLCTHNKRRLFGDVVEEKVLLNIAGEAAQQCWLEIPKHFPAVELDIFVVMPTHVHGILSLAGATGGANDDSPLRLERHPHGTSQTLGAVVRGFKIGVTKWFREHHGDVETVWQRNYYERVIRSEAELHQIREYISNNGLCRE